MSNLQFIPKWNTTINQLENGEPISAGEEGLINIAPRQLAENVFFVNDRVTQQIINSTIFEESIDTKVLDIEAALNTKVDDIEAALNTKVDDIEVALNAKADSIEAAANAQLDIVNAAANHLSSKLNKVRILALAGL